MFSVSAEPFNSPRRQLYGGWTLAEAGNNIWGQKTYYEMARKYSSDPDERKAAARWLKWWREFSKKDPSYKKRLRLAGKPYWKDAIMPALKDNQKAWLWQRFINVPFKTDLEHQRESAFLRHAPYWNYAVMNEMHQAGVPELPFAQGTATLDPIDTAWRTTDELQDAFKKSRGYGPLPPDREAEWLRLLPQLAVKKQEGMGGE